MRNPESWKPTKFEVLPAASDSTPRIRVPADPASLSAGSTLMATLLARWYQQALSRYAQGVLLELGAGALPYYALYRERTTAVWCTDWPQSLHGQPHADLHCDLNAGLPLRHAMADTVLAADLLEHIYRPQALLAEIHRVLRPGGTLLLNMPFMYWVHEAPHDYFRYTPHAVARMAADAGFEALAIDAVGGSLCVLADVAGKLLQSVRGVGPPLARGLQRAVLALQPPLPMSASSPLLVAAVLRRPA
jgi:SAM-dependent methyltransferase